MSSQESKNKEFISELKALFKKYDVFIDYNDYDGEISITIRSSFPCDDGGYSVYLDDMDWLSGQL